MTSISLATLARRAADLGNPLPCSDDTQLWFSEHPADLELAKAMCETCPLRRPCLAGAIDRAEPFGVWGGEIFEKGRIIAYKRPRGHPGDRKSTRLNSSHEWISYAVFCLKKKKSIFCVFFISFKNNNYFLIL